MDTKDVAPGHRMGRPMPGAIVALNKLHDEGDKIIIFTGRDVQHKKLYDAVADWLDYFGIPYDGITNVKDPSIDVFVDDRGLHFTNWTDTLGDLDKLKKDVASKPHMTKNAYIGLFTDISKPIDQQQRM